VSAAEFPPEDYMRLVSGEQDDLREHFDRVGGELTRQLAKREMLEPGARFLDIGCGCGRTARHLVDYPIERYDGFDRHLGMIQWAKLNIEAMDDRFRFRHVDVQSGYTEVDGEVGSLAASRFVFPYEDGVFSGALAASVFTHMDFAGTSRYLTETERVLAPGGGLLASFFAGEETGPMEGSGWNFTVREEDMRGAIGSAGFEIVQIGIAERSHSWVMLEKASLPG
jgi:SAM-dependent methyltransferase